LEFTIETILLLLVIFYIFVSIVTAFARCRKYLLDHPSEEYGRVYFQNDERNNLTFAGFSLTALALLTGLQFNKLIVLNGTIQFFSLAFVLIVLSFLFVRFRFVNAFIFFSDVFLNAGLLSICCGFLVFFSENVSWFDSSTIIFAVFIIILLVTLVVNHIFFENHAKET
jgi:hypothetical protein